MFRADKKRFKKNLTDPLNEIKEDNARARSQSLPPPHSDRSILGMLQTNPPILPSPPSGLSSTSRHAVTVEDEISEEESKNRGYVAPRYQTLTTTAPYSYMQESSRTGDVNIELSSTYHAGPAIAEGTEEEKEKHAPDSIRTSNLSDDEKEDIALYLLGHAKDSLKPLKNKEYLMIIPAVAVSVAAALTSKDFGDKFVSGLESLFTSIQSSSPARKNGIAWAIAASNVCAQLSLSFNSSINVFTRLLRSYQREPNATAATFEKKLTKKEIAYLATVPLSAFATYKVGLDTFQTKYQQSAGVSHTIGSLRYASSATVNANFVYDQIFRWRGDRDDLAMVRLLKMAKIHLNQLANSSENPNAFIEALQESHLLRNLNQVRGTSKREQLESVIKELIRITPLQETSAPSAEPCFTKTNCIVWLSTLLGAIVSLTNFKAGTKVPELFGLPVPKDLVEFFGNIKSADAAYLGITTLGMCLGIPSWFVNTIINTRSCINLGKSLTGFVGDLWNEGPRATISPYISKDGAIFALLSLLSIGYGAGNGGLSYKYPFIDIFPVPIIQMCLATIVFTGLGNLSQQGAAGKARDWWDGDLLKQALNTDDLLDMNLNKSSPTDQLILRRLLVNNVNHALDMLVSAVSKLDDVAINSVLSDELTQELENKFGTDLMEIVIHTPPDSPSPNTYIPSPSYSPPLMGIRVDPMTMTTLKEHSLLTSIQVESLEPAAPKPPLKHAHDEHAKLPPLSTQGVWSKSYRNKSSTAGIGFDASVLPPGFSPLISANKKVPNAPSGAGSNPEDLSLLDPSKPTTWK